MDALTYSIEVEWCKSNFYTDETSNIGIQFWVQSISLSHLTPDNEYWVDDVLYLDEMHYCWNRRFQCGEFLVYPNPVQDVLNIYTISVVDTINRF